MNEKNNLSPPPPKRKKKTKKLSQTLRAYNSRMHWTILLKFGMWGAEGGGRLHYENNVQQGSTELHMCKNRVLVLPVNILTVWRAGFTWPHDTLPCVLMKHYSTHNTNQVCTF